MKTVRVRDLVLGDGIPKICVPLIARTRSELEDALQVLKDSCFDLVEFRADYYCEEEAPALRAIRGAVGLKPVLYTIRTGEEGGQVWIDDKLYRERILAAASLSDLVDLQFERIRAYARNDGVNRDLVSMVRALGAKVLISWHDFDKTPEKEELLEKMCAMQRAGCDIAKIAVMPKTRKDVFALMEASVEMLELRAECPFIALSMGSLGKVTRTAGAFTGSCITFGTAGASSAPGQIPSGLLREILNVLDLPGEDFAPGKR